MKPIEWAVNTMPKTDDRHLPVMSPEEVKKARSFHESFPQYKETPLTKLPHMADHLGLGEIYIKDESYRFGLNAFKVLGGSYAMAKYVAKQTKKEVSDLPYQVLTSQALKEEFGQATFHRHRRQPRKRRCLGRQTAWTKGRCLHAKRHYSKPF